MQIFEKLTQAVDNDGRKKKEIAEAAGISAVALSKYLAGTITPKPPTLTKLAKALNLDLSYFFDMAETPQKKEEEGDLQHWKRRALEAEAKLSHLRTACAALGQHVSALGITVEDFSRIISG